MLRKDVSYREMSLSDSMETKSFLKSLKPQSTKMKENKENATARSDSQPLDFFFRKDLPLDKMTIYSDSNRFQSTKTYLECKLECLDSRKKTQSPCPGTLTPLQNKQASQERYAPTQQRKIAGHVISQLPLPIPSKIPTNQKTQEFNIYTKPLNIPSSYLDQNTRVQSEKNLSRMEQSPEKKQNPLKLYYITSVLIGFKKKGPNSIKEHLIQNMQGVIVSKKMKVPAVRKTFMLPATDKKTIIFDMDETLIHCNSNSNKPADVMLNVAFENGEVLDASVNIRPYTQYILQSLSRHFELIIFTASSSNYANAVIDYIDPQSKWISHRFYREHCIQTEDGNFVKDLRIFSNRKLSDILIVDNAPHSYMYQLANGVPILPYIDNKSDEELKSLLHYLLQFKNVKDVRDLNQAQLKLSRFSEYDDPMDLLKKEFSEYLL